LEGRVASHHRLLVTELLAHIDYLDEAIERLSGEVARVVAPFSPLLALLMTIPGVDRRTAEVIVAEIGTDMSRFPTAGHLASWAGLCPGTGESAGKHRSGATRKGSKWLRTARVQAANAAARTKGSYLAAHYARIKGRRGHKKAIVAVAHSILVIVLAPADHRPVVLRPWRRLLPGTPDQPGVQAPAGPPAGAHGPQGDPGTGRRRRLSSPHPGSRAPGIFNLACCGKASALAPSQPPGPLNRAASGLAAVAPGG
jgi:hypothetical protein